MAKVNNAFFDELGVSAPVVALVNQRRAAVASAIRASAPVGATANYKRGIVERGKIQNRRYVGLVVGTDEKTLIIEAKLGIMARALRSVSRG